MAGQETAKKVIKPTFIPGVVYIPDKIEVAEQLDLLFKVESDFADFLTCVRELLELMHLLKVKHLRSMVPLPLNVLREMRLLQGKGPMFKKFEKRRQEGIKKKPLESDLIEVIGKKTKPLWHIVALEPHLDPLLSWEEGEEEPPYPPDRVLYKKDLPLSRTHSEEIIASIRYLNYTKVQTTDKRLQRQMDMLSASFAGFKSVEAHKSFLDTLKPHWFKDLVRDAAKVGKISSSSVVGAFEKLGHFYDMSSTSVNLPKPKLCFIVMSLPLWDIARMSMQMAVQFILHDILKVPKSHNYLQEWLTARKLPYVIQPPVFAELVELQMPPPQIEEAPADAAKK